MVYDKEYLNRYISLECQEQEINRLKNAAHGEKLFTSPCLADDGVIKALIELSNIQFDVVIKDHQIEYYKL